LHVKFGASSSDYRSALLRRFLPDSVLLRCSFALRVAQIPQNLGPYDLYSLRLAGKDAPYAFYLGIYAGTLRIRQDVWASDGTCVGCPQHEATLRDLASWAGAWHRVKVEVDFAAPRAAVYIDDVVVHDSAAWTSQQVATDGGMDFGIDTSGIPAS